MIIFPRKSSRFIIFINLTSEPFRAVIGRCYKGVDMSYKDNLPKMMEELKALPFDERARLWAKYSQYPFKRQIRSLWYYIQCDRLNLRIEHKYLVKIRKYKDNPEKCLTSVQKNKYNFVPGTILTRYFKGIKHNILVNDDGSFSYNGDKYSTLSAVTTKIAGMKMSGNFFFGINKRYKHDN